MNSMSPPSMRYTQIMRIDEPFASVVSPTMFFTIFLSLVGWWNVIFIISLFIHTFIQAFHSVKDHYHYYGTNYDLKRIRQQNRRIPRHTRRTLIYLMIGFTLMIQLWGRFTLMIHLRERFTLMICLRIRFTLIRHHYKSI